MQEDIKDKLSKIKKAEKERKANKIKEKDTKKSSIIQLEV